MRFHLDRATLILERTPSMLDALLRDLPAEWTHGNEGPDTWSPHEVVGHLIHGERTDWMVRVNIILRGGDDRRFAPFDRSAHLSRDPAEPIAARLEEFKALRAANLAELAALRLTEADLDRTGVHPAFGSVTLRQLLSTWVAHDLDHVVQIARVMAKQLTAEAGPWVEYLRVLR